MAPPYTDATRVRAVLTRAGGNSPGTAGSIAVGELEIAITAAADLINSRLGNLYAVPFDPVPALITSIATALAAYDADLTYREVRDYDSDLNPVLLRYKQATELLDQLQKGTATLPDYEAPDPDPGIPDNPNDPGSVVGVFNPDLEYPVGRVPYPRNYYDWTHW